MATTQYHGQALQITADHAARSVARYGYDAGIYEQSDSGWRLVRWSRHQTQAAAERAARGYVRRLWANSGPTGGAYSWSAWWRSGDSPAVEVTLQREEA